MPVRPSDTSTTEALESRPWTIEPELPPDVSTEEGRARVRTALDVLRSEAQQHAAEAREEIETLSTVLVAESSAQTDAAAAHRRLAAAEQTVLDCEAAIERLEQGTYGWCTRCSERIPDGRLELRPHSPYCVTCTSTS